MKRLFSIISLILLAVIIDGGTISAQTPSITTLSHDFTPPDTGGIFYCWQSDFKFIYTNDELKIAVNKKNFDYDRFVTWVAPFKLKGNPWVSFKMKANKAFNFTVSFKDHGDPDNSIPQDQVDKTFSVPADSTYRTYFFDLTSDLSTLTYTLDEVQFDPGAGPLTGNLWIDDFKMGTAAKPAYDKPNINQAPNLALAANTASQRVQLNGINDGSGGLLTLAVTATSDNTALIPDPTVLFTDPHDTGSLVLNPVAGLTGTANITVTVTSSAPVNNVKTMTFLVAVFEGGGTAFSDNFNSGTMDTTWKANSEYVLNQSAGVLNIDCNKLTPWKGFTLELGKLYDLSAYPYVNLKLATKTPFVISVYLKDVFGGNALRSMRIFPATDFVNYCFDFTDLPGVDLTAIDGMIFAFNGEANGYVGQATFEDLLAGSAATRFPDLAAIADKEYYFNTGAHSILLTDIINSTGITASSTGHVLQNLSVGTIGGDTARFNFESITDAKGKDTVTLTLAGANGFQNNALSFLVELSGNKPPSIDSVPDMEVLKGQSYTVNLTGITDGDKSARQELTLAVNAMGPNVDIQSVNYTSDDNHGSFSFMATDTGITEIRIRVSDQTVEDTIYFKAHAFAALNNPPVIDPIADVRYFFGSGLKTVPLTGLGDGDGTSQALTITAVSSDTSLVHNPITVNYTSGATGSLSFTPSSVKKGIDTIIVTLTDNGGSLENNGNKSTLIKFKISTGQAPITGYVVPMTDFVTDSINNVWGPEAWGTQINIAYVDSGSFQSMKIDMKDKWDFGGIWMQLPVELDLTNHPQISYEVYSVDTATYHWNYLYDDGTDGAVDRNTQNSAAWMLQVPKNKWTRLSFDYTNPGDLNNDQGKPIAIDRISAVLLNLHYRPGAWPFTNFTGTVYYRNIRIGDQAIVPVKVYPCAMQGVSDMGVFVNAGDVNLTLTAISDGQDSTENVTLVAKSSNTSLIPTPEVGAVNPDGTADLKFTVGANDGVSLITVTASAPGSSDKIISFRVVISQHQITDAAIVNVDLSQKFQTIEGLGTFEPATFNDDYYLDMGSSGVRLGIIGNHIEPVNDNDDPSVLDMSALDHTIFNWNSLRKLKENGVEKFILTVWSPPAWMKQGLSYSLVEQAVEWENTDNKVMPYLYDEYAENVVAIIKLIKEEADIDLYAVCPQNEPAFNEPYESAILGPAQFVNFIKVLGPRLAAEGLNTKIYMPEQVYGIGFYSMYDYMTALNADAVASQYTDIIAVHGYASDGITAGIPDFSGWKYLYDAAQVGHSKELWMTETFISYASYTDAMKVAGAIHGGLRYGNISWWTNWAFEGMQITNNLPNSAFYTTKNYFKFIKPGAIRVGSSSSNSDVMEVAFYHPVNHTYTVVLLNKGVNAVPVQLTGSNIPTEFQAFRTSKFENFIQVDSVKNDMFLLPPNSVTTLYATNNSALTIDAVPDQYISDYTPKQVDLTGISDGNASTVGLSLTVKTDNSVLISDISVSDINSDGTATLNYTPAADQTGEAKVTLSLTDGSNSRELVFYIVAGYTAVKKELTGHLNLYPNPATEFITLVVPSGSFKDLTITDVSGKEVYRTGITGTEMVISTASFDKGIYFLKIEGENQTVVSKFVKQ